MVTITLPTVTIIKTFPKLPILLPIGAILGPIMPLIVPGSGSSQRLDDIPIPRSGPQLSGGGPPDGSSHGGGPDKVPQPIGNGSGQPNNQDPGPPPEKEDPVYKWSVAFQNWCFTLNSYLTEKGKDATKQTAMGPGAPWFAYTITAVPFNHIVNADLRQYLDQWLFDIRALAPHFDPKETFSDDDRSSIANATTQLNHLIEWLAKLDSALKWYGFMNDSAGNKWSDSYKTGGLHLLSDSNKPAEQTQKVAWETLFRNWRNNLGTHMTAIRRTETSRRIGVLNEELCLPMAAGTSVSTILEQLNTWESDTKTIANRTKTLLNVASYDQPLQHLLGNQLNNVRQVFDDLVKKEPQYTYSGDGEK
jgi:hypothetical protein